MLKHLRKNTVKLHEKTKKFFFKKSILMRRPSQWLLTYLKG